MTVGELKIKLSVETDDFTAGIEGMGDALKDMETKSIAAMENLKNTFLGYSDDMAAIGKMLGAKIGDGIAQSVADRISSINLSAANMYGAVSAQNPSVSNTYNTYKTTYNASNDAANAVSTADFENRIRRAYV